MPAARFQAVPSPFRVLICWLPTWAAISALAMLSYVEVQQAYRQGANDPQIQLAEDAAAALSRGTDSASLVPAAPVDMAASLAPWMTIVDGSNRALASSARLDEREAQLPAGALEAARRQGENRITWQPRPGVRSATISVLVPDGSRRVVIAGRSLRESERRVGQMNTRALAAWLAASVASLVAAALGEWLPRS